MIYTAYCVRSYCRACSQNFQYTSGKHVRVMYTPRTPLLYSKTGVFRGIPIFLIFAPKHRLWVLVRTASARRFKRVPTIYVLSKNKKNINIFLMKFSIFKMKKNLYILHGQVFVMLFPSTGLELFGEYVFIFSFNTAMTHNTNNSVIENK